jgi:uncharacterized repeat protein (TIGR01451 family)
MPYISVNAGFDLELLGTAVFSGLNINGSSSINIASGANLTINNSFSPSTGDIVNAGTMHVASSINLNGGVSLTNSGTMTVDQSLTLNGPLINSGVLTVAGTLTVNGSGRLQNDCALSLSGDLNNNGPTSGNYGIVLIGGRFSNNGTWSQSSTGTLRAATLTDDGKVNGFGQYRFTGATGVQGTFAGDSASAAITVDSTAPVGQIFSVQTGAIANVIRGSVVPGELDTYPAPECATARTSADLGVSVVSPDSVTQGASLAFTITVTNSGPSTAAAVTVTSVVPAALTAPALSSGGSLNGSTATWSLGALASGASRTVTLSGQAAGAPGSSVVDAASASSRTADPDPTNNDGSSDGSRAATTIVAAIPVNRSPTATAQGVTVTTGGVVVGVATATDPDTDQELTFSIVAGPSHGRLVMLPGGAFRYRAAVDFAGVDSATFRACDNGSPVDCDDAVLTFRVFPVATDGAAQTFEAQPVSIPLVPDNASPGAALAGVLTDVPAHGGVVVDAPAGTVTYTPRAGFVGSDSFSFSVCAADDATLCASAQVSITVLRPNHPPVIATTVMSTTTGQTVQSTLGISDPDGDSVTSIRRLLPRSGSIVVATSGLVRYVPRAGFAGVDPFQIISCDDGSPTLCATASVTAEVSPVAEADSGAASSGIPVTVDVAANDLGTVDAATIVTRPRHGTATVVAGGIRYMSAADYVGDDEFVYRVCAPDSDLCATATASLTVTAAVIAPPKESAGSSNSPEANARQLGFTGVHATPTVIVGFGVIAAGIAFLLMAAIRRRRRSTGQ